MKILYGLPHKKVDVTSIVHKKWIKNLRSGGPEIIIPVTDVARTKQLGVDPIPNVVKQIFIEEGKEKPYIVNSQQQLNINLNYSKNNDNKVVLTKKYKYCVIYSYCERKKSDSGCNPMINLDFFCKNGVHNNSDVFYIFVINHYQCHINIPQLPNVRIYTRQNSGRCEGAWRFGYTKINQNNFDYFIFINDTVKGPFFDKNDWYNKFGNMINSRVKLSGLNKLDKPGIITGMIWCVDKIGLNIIKNTLWKNTTDSQWDEIYKKSRHNYIHKIELGLSKYIINANYLTNALYCNSEVNDQNNIKDKIGKLFLKK